MGVFFITSSGYILLAVTPTSGIVSVIPGRADSGAGSTLLLTLGSTPKFGPILVFKFVS
jgi:hypothetical protein